MNLTQILLRVAGFLAIIAAVALAVHEYGAKRFDQGAADVQAKWDKDRLEQQQAYNRELIRRTDENIRQAGEYSKKLAKQKKEQADEITQIERRSDELAASRLRLPDSVCADAGFTRAAKAGSGKEAGGPAAPVVLPEPTEQGLRGLAKFADQVTAQCRADAKFIDDNGLREKQ